MNNETHLHFIIWACETKSDNGFSGVTYVDVLEQNEGLAISKAKKLAPGRKYYWVNNILEHHNDHSS